jgi:hypothetical protein
MLDPGVCEHENDSTTLSANCILKSSLLALQNTNVWATSGLRIFVVEKV